MLMTIIYWTVCVILVVFTTVLQVWSVTELTKAFLCMLAVSVTPSVKMKKSDKRKITKSVVNWFVAVLITTALQVAMVFAYEWKTFWWVYSTILISALIAICRVLLEPLVQSFSCPD